MPQIKDMGASADADRAASPTDLSPFGSSRGSIPCAAQGLRLCKIFPDEDLRLCEPVMFTRGRPAVDTVLRRAAISGRVTIDPEGPLPDHFADILDAKGDMIGNVALDAKSFRALKDHWMRCKYENYELR